MNTKTNTYLMLVCVLTLLAFCGFYYAAVYVYGLTEKTTTLKQEVESQEIKIKHDQLLSKSAQNTSEERAQLDRLFIQSNRSIDFISMVEHQADYFSLTYITNQIENVDTDALASQHKQLLKINMTVGGGWNSIVRFLEYIESLPYAIKIDKIELSSASKEVLQQIVDTTGKASSKQNVATGGNVSVWKLSITFMVIKIKDDAQ